MNLAPPGARLAYRCPDGARFDVPSTSCSASDTPQRSLADAAVRQEAKPHAQDGGPANRMTEAALSSDSILTPKWYTTAQVAEMLGFGLYKTKALIASGELRSLKDGKYRRILPEWVDEYVARRAQENPE